MGDEVYKYDAQPHTMKWMVKKERNTRTTHTHTRQILINVVEELLGSGTAFKRTHLQETLNTLN